MAPMGDDAHDQCRWAALAGAEAAVAKTDLVDLPPREQVARGRELLSMLGCGKEDAKPPAAQNQSRESARHAAGIAAEMDSSGSMASSMSRHLDSLASQPQDVHVPSYAQTSAVGLQQVVNYDGSEWMVQGGFGSRPGTPAAQSVPLWGSSVASGSVHTATPGTPWPASNAVLTNWPMGAGMPAATAAATVTPVAVMGPAGTGGLWQQVDAGTTASVAGWAPGTAMAIPSELQCVAAAPAMGLDLAVPVPVPVVMSSSPGLQSSMLNRNQMRAEAAPYVPGAMPLSVGA